MTGYCGRFAPSPTGPLHFGSLVTAVGSFLQARSQHGSWLLRVEDVDCIRSGTGVADEILATLECFGLYWDGTVMVQTKRTDAYVETLTRLNQQGVIYGCGCSRKDVAAAIQMRNLPVGVYPGTCRNGVALGKKAKIVRLLVPDKIIACIDAIQDVYQQNLGCQVGDFPIRRADGLFAYQLAVVVDDNEQQITEIVRGSDLLDSTPRQIYLQQCLGFAQPAYVHLPVACNADGNKLSKQTHAAPLDKKQPVISLWSVLRFLGQQPPLELQYENLDQFWAWAIDHWRLSAVPKVMTLPEPIV